MNIRKLQRYLPLAAIVALQLLIISIAPSKSPQELTAFGSRGPGTGGAEDPAFIGDDADSVDGIVDGAGAGAGGQAGRGAGSGPGGGAGAGAGGAGEVAGSVEHCIQGRQFDPAMWAFAPPCVPNFVGPNGGDTYLGVTRDKINVVYYDANLGQAVERLLEAQGSNPTPQELQDFQAVLEPFLNQHFELYGRKIDLQYWRGQCVAVPPDYPCLRNEMRRIVQERQPFWVIWNTSLASPAFDELSALKVLNAGGWGFRDSFSQQRRPYHWDVLMGGSQQVKQVAEWWCDRMHGGKAVYAGETGTGEGQNPPNNNIRGKTRVLGAISTDDPENKLAIAEFKRHLADNCGATVAHEYYYAQDITRAEDQRRIAVARMRENPEATTIMCFCDLVAPIFLYQTCEEQKYYPEHVVVGTGFMDADVAAQAYDTTLPPPGHQFENALGLAQQAKPEPVDGNTAARIWKAGGRTDRPFPYQSAEADLAYYLMVASLIQTAGPTLNPSAVERNASKLSFQFNGNADEFRHQRSFNPAAGDYTWFDTMREVYWSKQQPSTFNKENGTYMTLNKGGRVWFSAGQYPKGLLNSIPPKPR